MTNIYHGRMAKNTHGTNRIIGPGEKCLVPTDKWFWKDPEDIKSCGVKTGSHTKKERTVNNQAIDNTFNIESALDNGFLERNLIQLKKKIVSLFYKMNYCFSFDGIYREQ